MSYKAVISDWNGTLTSATEEGLNKKIGFTLLEDTGKKMIRGNIKDLSLLGKLIYAAISTKINLSFYKNGKGHLHNVYNAFNFAIRGQDANYINNIVDDFAKETISMVNEDILNSIKEVHTNGKYTGILSAAYDRVIRKTLQESNYSDIFDKIVANTLQTDNDKVVGLTFEIYGRKPEILIHEFFEKEDLREDNTLYIGDSEDDEPIADILKSGNFIVSYFATEDFKQKLASKYSAVVPRNKEDFMKYLQSKEN